MGGGTGPPGGEAAGSCLLVVPEGGLVALEGAVGAGADGVLRRQEVRRPFGERLRDARHRKGGAPWGGWGDGKGEVRRRQG